MSPLESGGGNPTGASAPIRRVLVVEDDPGLCDAIGRLARGLGAEVWQAQSLERALRLLEDAPQLVITDLRLGGLSAFPLVEAAVARRPPPAVVAMSGQASAEESFRLGQLGVRAYLAKPFASEQLLAAVERARATPPGPEAPPNGGDAGASRGSASRAARLRAAWDQAVARVGWAVRKPRDGGS